MNLREHFIRLAGAEDLPAVNAVVEAAVMAWPLPLRLRRLSLPVLTYDAADAADYEILLREDGGRHPVGVAAWRAQPADAGCAPELPPHALLHGLYVHPVEQRRGVGRALQRTVARRAEERGLAGILVKAERVSTNYFAGCGYRPLAVPQDQPGAYPYRFWIPLHPDGPLAAGVAPPAAKPA
jgi:GNAT superfamily N-acetyltransferase